jgi:hypothetical protein
MKLNQILKKYSLVANRFEKEGKATIIDTNDGRFVYKESKINKQIFDYLKSRNFDYMPRQINNLNDDYTLTEYLEELDIPKEQKVLDLVKLTALLHNKTTHYKEIDLDDYEKTYSDIDNNLKYLYNYYTELITNIESKVYMSPSEYLLARNISQIYNSIAEDQQRLKQWHKLITEKRKQRQVVLHNNLKLDHFIRGENSYLISWDKAKIASPVFDIYKLYENHALDFDFSEILNEYEKNYPLQHDEKLLLLILIGMPDLIELSNNEYTNCQLISKSLDKMYKTNELILKQNPKDREEQ